MNPNTFYMGYPAVMGRGTSRTDATRARNLALTAFWRRNSSRISRRQKAVGASSRSIGAGRLCISARRLWRPGERGKGGSRRLINIGRCALTASRKNEPPVPASFWFHRCTNYGFNQMRVAAAPIRGLETDSCRPLATPDSEIKGMSSYASLQQGIINPNKP
jgi:hypothetical protein